MPGEPGEAGVLGILLLQVGAVPQDDGRRRCGSLGAPRWSGETVSHQGREVAAVVEVGVSEDDV